MHIIPAIFFGSSAFIIAIASVIFSIVLVKKSSDDRRTIRTIFLLLSSSFFSLSLIFVLLRYVFHLSIFFSGFKVPNFEAAFLLLGLISLNAVLWQEAEHSNLI